MGFSQVNEAYFFPSQIFRPPELGTLSRGSGRPAPAKPRSLAESLEGRRQIPRQRGYLLGGDICDGSLHCAKDGELGKAVRTPSRFVAGTGGSTRLPRG